MKELTLINGEVSFVSEEDFLYLSTFNWTTAIANNTKYAKLTRHSMHHMMHQLVAFRMSLTIPLEYDIDHIDNNGLNNQRENLRAIPHWVNTTKGKLLKTMERGKTPFVLTRGDRFQARTAIGRRTSRVIGTFDTPELAYEAAASYIRSTFPEWADVILPY